MWYCSCTTVLPSSTGSCSHVQVTLHGAALKHWLHVLAALHGLMVRPLLKCNTVLHGQYTANLRPCIIFGILHNHFLKMFRGSVPGGQ
jgi:hypothetical protein